MNQLNNEHPHDDRLIAYAMNGDYGDIKNHVDSCPSCSRYVKELRTIKIALQSLPDEEVPEKLRKAILRTIKNKSHYLSQWFEFNCATWYKNPFILGIGIICVIIFLYIFFVFLL